ncbi:Wadjet anti-phage system protein JetD domain-containing protein [Teredinibacter franksiae]|uniref:Wadjet anti-phage system protein JetD domain-containing protein n=1 Tax=Teredinibacter franksiae TaxID=2761453 RepID=UPI001627203C|nr:Wadjet anti-phage system protein JetD domain-containing protein [Teredinibacter franksiae]
MNIQEHVFRTRPRWVDEEPMVAGLLDTFLHKLEKGHRLTMRVNSKTLPELFDFDSGENKYLWSLVKSLNNEYHIVSIRYARNKPFQEPYDNAQLVFNEEKEELVREWLNRPALDPYALVWQDTLRKHKDRFEDHGQTLAEQMIRLPDQGAEQTLRAFARLGGELQKPITLRALSARCFWGDSKFLDHREELVRALYPSASHNLLPRPVIMTVCLSSKIDRVIFIENQDSFLALTQLDLDNTTLVYCAGFRGTATRVRERGKVAFTFFGNLPTPAQQQAFEQWWFAEDDNTSVKVRFWGDLDFAGMSILKALKQTFPDIDAWRTGYRPLLEMLAQRLGHEHESSGKERQKDPELTGCELADLELLPAMRESGEFVDQEAVLVGELEI